MKGLTVGLLCLAFGCRAGLGQGSAELWRLEPGVVTQGQTPVTWTLDLRNKSPEQATAEAGKLSSRVYGPTFARLHHPLVIQTKFSTLKVFAFELAAISSGGSDLVVRTNGTLLRRYAWPAAAVTHKINRIVSLPLAPGETTVSFEVNSGGGVAVIKSYFVADSAAQLPTNAPVLPYDVAQLPAEPATVTPFEGKVSATGGVLKTDDGFRGIWYSNQPTKDVYRFKYSGGLATYPQQHAPIAIYCKEVDKTFFVYGGTTARTASDKQDLLHMVSYYDHKTGQVARPRILLDKHTDDAHDNPTLQVDDQGYLWIFSASHGTGRPSYIHRSVKPWSITEFKRILVSNFSYTGPWYVPNEGFLFLHTHYNGAKSLGINAIRTTYWMTSPDGLNWSEPQVLAGIGQGDYQINWRVGKRVATAFDFHPAPLGLNARANIYYAETDDLGKTWRNVQGQPLKLPLTTTNNPALAYDSRCEGLLVYLKDINFDPEGHPVILFLTSKGFEPGPENGPRQWQTMRWTGTEWVRRPFTTSGNNYDHGSLYLENDGTWRVIGSTELGPQPYNPGGEMVMWTSTDQGNSWKRVKQLTSHSLRNHTYPRRPLNAHPDFYALWADGDARQPSESSLYFTNQRGDHVWRLPPKMETDFAMPQIVW